MHANSMTSRTDHVVVVGAGPSGLAAAWRLREAGVDVVVLERRDRVGGQLHTITQDGFVLEAGTTVLPGAYSSVMQLAKDIGIAAELVQANSLLGIVHDGDLHQLRSDHLVVDALRTKMLSTRAKLKTFRLVRDSLRIRKLLSYEDLSSAGQFDVETPAQYCRRRGLGGEFYDCLVEPIVRAGAGVPADVISVVEFFFLAQRVLGTKLYAFRDGYSSFAERMAAPLDVRLGAHVHEVVEDDNGVRVTWQDADGRHTETAAGAVVSSMGNEVPGLVPQLAPERADFLRRLNYTSCITFNLALTRPPDNLKPAFVVLPATVSDGLFAIIVEHNKAPSRVPPGKGLVTLYTMNQWSVDNMDRTDEELLAAILPEAEKVVPGIANDIEFTRVNRWYPVLVYSRPGLYRELGAFHAARPRDSRIHLAGSYNSSGNVNTATVAGERAARELLESLSARQSS
jgi:protoporphyrinogen/coproporphyrinogen III oxidase